MNSRWTQNLNAEQIEAVCHNYGPLLILAGAGAGKTTVLVKRTGRLIEEGIARPDQMVVLTFTNKAARELKSRVTETIGKPAQKLWAGTFHSFGLNMMKKYHQQLGLSKNFTILDQSDSQSVLREILNDVSVVGKAKYDLDVLAHKVQFYRFHGEGKSGATDEYDEAALMILPKYLKRMALMDSVDFESLLLDPLHLLKTNSEIAGEVRSQIQQLMVDEFQDTNPVQMQLIDKLLGEHKNLSVVGDDDQSIYGFRGAEVKNILQFPKRYDNCLVIKLEKNYRSQTPILDFANSSIKNNKDRHGKVLVAQKETSSAKKPELFICEDEDIEADLILREVKDSLQAGVPGEEIAVLYRSNSQSGLIEAQLRQNRIDYQVSGGFSFLERKEVKDALAYLKAAITGADASLFRILNVPSRGVGEQALERIKGLKESQNIRLIEILPRSLELNIAPRSSSGLIELGEKLEELKKLLLIESPAGLADRLKNFFVQLGLRAEVQKQSANMESADKKWMLTELLFRIVETFVTKNGVGFNQYKEFFENLELKDTDQDEKGSKVRLMTLHASKGLEFKKVIFIGIEEEIIPHRSLGANVDEERRLFYVGVTRAKDQLILTRCRQRKRAYGIKPVAPSRFLLEVPLNLYSVHESAFRPLSSNERESLVAQFLKK